MNTIFLLIGTGLALLFIFYLIKGTQEDYMLDALDSDVFPLKSIYIVGLMWQKNKLGKVPVFIEDKLKSDLKLYYSPEYSEYYTRIIWAQVLSFAHLALTIGFLLAGLSSPFFLIIGILFCAFLAYYFLTYTREKMQKRQEDCELEFPNAVSKLALIVNSGVILHDAWKLVANGNDGLLYDMMKQSCDEIDNGKAEVDALYDFGILTNSDDIKKFTSALIQSIERGGADLTEFLVNQSTEIWELKRQYMLQKGERAAGALLMPIALMFGGIMLIVLTAAMQSFSF